MALSLVYPHNVFAGTRTTWSVQAQGGTPPYTFHWDATSCQGIIRYDETSQSVTSVFEIGDTPWCDGDFYANLIVYDADGRATSWTHRYQRNVTYYSSAAGCGTDATYVCGPGQQQ